MRTGRMDRNDKGKFVKQPPRYCDVEGCNGKHSARGYCARHLVRIYRYGSLLNKHDVEPRFHANYEMITESGCWIWMGACNQRGYGQIRRKGRSVGAHRLSWELHNGPIPEGLQVLHKCDVPPCVNPEHLFLGTQKDNIHDAIKKGRVNPKKLAANRPRVNGRFIKHATQ